MGTVVNIDTPPQRAPLTASLGIATPRMTVSLDIPRQFVSTGRETDHVKEETNVDFAILYPHLHQDMTKIELLF